jgi:outer membrane receptor protein involved in Fe transport
LPALQVRTTPISRLTLTGSYSFLNRNIHYDFSAVPTVSPINTSITILPTVPRNKLIGTANARLPWRVLGIVQVRYEGGLTLQDTSYPTTSHLFLPFAASFVTMDIGGVPIRNHFSVQAGVKNLFDRNYSYTAGYPEAGRTWYLNGRFQF